MTRVFGELGFGETGIGEMGHKINCQWSVYDLLVIALTINT